VPGAPGEGGVLQPNTMQVPSPAALGKQSEGKSVSSGSDAHEEHGKGPRPRGFYSTLGFLYAVAMIEGADTQLLPATFRALEVSLGLSPADLAMLGLCQAITQSLSAPMWGTLADHGWQRKWLLASGAFAWGCITLALAFTMNFPMMLGLRALNGVALGTLIPITQSLIVDMTHPTERGFYFGWTQFAMCVGIVGCSVFATSISNMVFFGLEGWCVAFIVVASLSAIFSVCLALFMIEPERRHRPDTSITVTGEMRRFRSYWRINTFKVIVLQGIFGSIPGSALAFLTMYFQYVGIGDFQSAMLFAINIVAVGFGGIVGGSVGDRLSIWSTNHGRPLAAQISVLSGIPILWSLLALVPRNPSYWTIYATLLMSLGLLGAWCGSGVKKPILSELVQSKSKASIIAFDTALEGASAACFGAPLVGLFAEHLFNYKASRVQVTDMSPAMRATNADALSRSMLLCTVVPWILCFIGFSMLHFTYGPDVAAATAAERRGEDQDAEDGARNRPPTATTSLI